VPKKSPYLLKNSTKKANYSGFQINLIEWSRSFSCHAREGGDPNIKTFLDSRLRGHDKLLMKKLQDPNHFKEDTMKPLFKGLETETQLLVALGSAVASGCIPCLESITGLARAENIDEKKMRAAAIIGQFVKDQPASNMKMTADRLLGTHLQSAPVNSDCPLDPKETAPSEQMAGCAPGATCECS
jgi:hypothetical protein